MKPVILSDTVRLISFFIFLCCAGAFLLQIPFAYKSGEAVPFIDALFTAVSAVCVTGLSTVDMEVYSRVGFIIIMILIELGGLGIISFISIFIGGSSKKVSLVNRRVVRRFSIDNIENNPRNIVKNILFYAFIIQGVGFLCLMPTLKMHGVEDFVFDALFLSVSAFCNAGFAVYSDSLAQFNNSVFLNAVIMALIILGGIGFIVLQNIRQRLFGTKKHVSLHTKIVLYITAGLILLGAAVFFMIDFSHAFADLPLHGKISAAFFQSVTPRTCGFETIPQSSFSFTSNLFTVFLMFIGGSPASVAGGIKTTTFFIALLYAIAGDEQKSTVNILKRRLSAETINKSVNIIIRSVLILFFAVLLLSITEAEQLKNGNIGAFDLLFETVSAFGTVGLSLGLTSSLSFGGKIIIILTMFIGRTALAGMMISLPGFEIQRKAIKYPHEDILIG